jgi:tetratricopeptide (TPR) repeat protein
MNRQQIGNEEIRAEVETNARSAPSIDLEPMRQRLKGFLNERKITAGSELLTAIEPQLLNLRQNTEGASEILLLVAQWVDTGFRTYHFLDTLLENFPQSTRVQLRVGDYLRIRMVEAFRALGAGDAATTIRICDTVLRLDTDLLDAELQMLAHLWKGRAHRRLADYQKALEHVTAARRCANALSHPGVYGAVIKIQESWLLFQQGSSSEALRLLQEAEDTLKHTDHLIALGNIESARGRIVRRQGDYKKALDYFDRAVALYESAHPDHPNLARTLNNIGFVKWLLALQLKKNIDSEIARRKSAADVRMEDEIRSQQLRHFRSAHHELYRSAVAQLDRAKELYKLHADSSGLGAVLVNAGQLHLDHGDIDLAAREAAEAHELGVRTGNLLLAARARILQALIENTHVNELLGDVRNTPKHALTAKQYCLEAVELARQTQNKRLLMNAHVALGETACNEFFHDWQLGELCFKNASTLLEPSDADHVVEELNSLKLKLLRNVGIDDTLRAWSEGNFAVGKTFNELTEEFAELVIPRVWEKEDHKISRVAKRLAMSPQKVRRILRSRGFLNSDRVARNSRPAYGPRD